MKNVIGHVSQGDCLDVLSALPENSVDLVFTSPPYEAARTYGVGFSLRGQDWADWCADRFEQCVRISRGLVAWVVEGQTSKFRWSAAPALLMVELHKRGIHLRKPACYYRHGISGGGGTEWLRNDWEFIICGSKGGRLPWSDNTAMGHPPKYAAGGEFSNRKSDGARANAKRWGEGGKMAETRNGDAVRRTPKGDPKKFLPPPISNPGNVIKCKVGGGHLGSKLAHENEAPFSEELAEFFIRSFCPPGGIVLDPFAGSGTVPAVAIKTGRRFAAIDIRQNQIELMERRILEALPLAPVAIETAVTEFSACQNLEKLQKWLQESRSAAPARRWNPVIPGRRSTPG